MADGLSSYPYEKRTLNSHSKEFVCVFLPIYPNTLQLFWWMIKFICLNFFVIIRKWNFCIVKGFRFTLEVFTCFLPPLKSWHIHLPKGGLEKFLLISNLQIYSLRFFLKSFKRCNLASLSSKLSRTSYQQQGSKGHTQIFTTVYFTLHSATGWSICGTYEFKKILIISTLFCWFFTTIYMVFC